MKKFLIILLSLTPAVLYTSCKKDEVVSKVVDVSFPEIELKGDKYVTLNVGQAYTDPGAVATDDISGAKTDIMAEYSSLDINTPGVYYMQYTTKNANGYITNVGRYIAVTNFMDDFDLSGTYQRAGTTTEVNISKVARALYKTDDMGGAQLPDAAYFVVLDNQTIRMGPQLSETIGSEIEGADEELLYPGTDSTIISYRLFATGYGTQLRSFVKVQ